MKGCISKIICLASKLIYLWRTSHTYACRKCKNIGSNACFSCKVCRSCHNARGLRSVGVPSNWERKD